MKKLFSLLLALLTVLSLSLFCTGTTLAASQTRFILKADKTAAKPAEVIHYTVSLAPCEHIQALQVTLAIPDGLIYQNGGKAAEGIAQTLGAAMADYADEGKTFASFGLGDYSSEKETLLFSFSCKVADTVKKGDVLRVNAEVIEAVDPDDEPLPAVFVNDSAAVTATASGQKASFGASGGAASGTTDADGVIGAIDQTLQTDENGNIIEKPSDGGEFGTTGSAAEDFFYAVLNGAKGISPWAFVLIGVAVVLIAAGIIFFIRKAKRRKTK